ncbi:hypothetical protein PQH03_09180 [Ralstonia insidiosa]|jgi:hypothetical protein|nr:hypothetical protein [Ralstonia insidiosa]KMW46303.1 hypothetical protein AC240_16230 [Ralstonia sp. MD27]MBX3770941.1 hypothetical protein [Ralstonia pickettii]NPA00206.1 hypothetical protein [Betaproteobacteria bacterium]MBA9855097.1 hypothetical protein [Ralstonia insidiosa]MBA9872039.1 hypothetical protein [Ralstonia insidiosa]
MQTQKIRQRLEHAEHTIAQLSELCMSQQGVPDALKQSVEQLDEQARQCHARLENTQDTQALVQAVDQLEAASDRAKMACQNAGKIDHSVHSAVMRTHDELSRLKHHLH